MTAKNMLRTMHFFSNAGEFNPKDMADMEKRNEFYKALMSTDMSAETANKYCLALTTIILFEATNDQNSSELRETFRLTSSRCKDEVRGLKSRYTASKKKKRRDLENKPNEYLQVLEHNITIYQ